MKLWKPAAALASGYVLARLVRTWNPKGKVVLITGGGRGLGLELARVFGAKGARLVLCGRSDEELARAQAELAGRGVAVHVRLCDVTRDDEVQRFVSDAAERFGRIDCVVNNAGIIQVGPMETMTLADYQAAMESIFWGTLRVTLAALPHLVESRGRLVNVSSIGGAVAVPHLLPYSAAKFATLGFSTGLAAEVAKSGVRVTTILPGLMRTGSYVHALVKGQKAREAEWFAVGATLPGVTMSSRLAARRIVFAVERGERFVTLGLPFKAFRLFHALAPNVSIALLGLVNRLLPAPADTGEATEAKDERAAFDRAPMRTVGERAARRNNEIFEPIQT